MEIYVITDELGNEHHIDTNYDRAVAKWNELCDIHGKPFDLIVEA